MLQLEHGFRVEEMHFAFAAPLVFTTEFEFAVRPFFRAAWVTICVAISGFAGDVFQTNAAEAAAGAREVLIDQLLAQPDRFEDLGASI